MSELLIPLAPGSLLASASGELERQIRAVVPPGKRGAAMTVVDKDGVRVGIAAVYKDAVTVSLEISKRWATGTAPPDASLKIKAVF
jgi:hypothetical protein